MRRQWWSLWIGWLIERKSASARGTTIRASGKHRFIFLNLRHCRPQWQTSSRGKKPRHPRHARTTAPKRTQASPYCLGNPRCGLGLAAPELSECTFKHRRYSITTFVRVVKPLQGQSESVHWSSFMQARTPRSGSWPLEWHRWVTSGASTAPTLSEQRRTFAHVQASDAGS